MSPVNQTKLYGHSILFNELISINKNKFPKSIILSGRKGIGKSTLAYHLINYFFSRDEKTNYDIVKHEINPASKSFNLIKKDSHPNFFKIGLKIEKKTIEISQIREMIHFTNKSSFNNKSKFILIDDIEFLNISSVNALLKSIEEPNDDCYFILINNSEKKLLKTLKSRCIEFKVQLKANFYKDIVNLNYGTDIYDSVTNDLKFSYLSPSVLINTITFCDNHNLDVKNLKLEEILGYIFKNNLFKKDFFAKNYTKDLIEIYFQKKILTDPTDTIFDLYSYFNKKYDYLIKFNLDFESYFIEFNSKLLNE